MRERFPRRLENGSTPTPVTATAVHIPEYLSEQDQESVGLVQEYLQTLRRYKWSLAAFALAGMLVGILFGLRTVPMYRARTSLDIRNLNGDFMNLHSVAQTGDSGAESDSYLQTQIKLMQSETLVQNTVDRIKGEDHPAFVERNDLLSRIQRMLHLGSPKPIPYDVALANAAQQLKVKPLGVTRLVEVTCDAWSPELAARFCNQLSATFQENDLQTRSLEASKTSAWLTRQVADIRQRAQETQAKLEAAVGNNGLTLSPTNTVGEDRLRALQDELVKAQAERISKEAEAGIDRNANPGSVSVVLDNPAHRGYETQLLDLRGQLAKLSSTLTDENPRIKTLKAQIASAEEGMNQTDQLSMKRQGNELAAARHREGLLSSAYAAELSRVSADLQRRAKVSLMKSELDSEQQLYQTLLQRAKEAGFASAMQAATIRVVDEAKAPKVPFSPRQELAAGVGCFLGALLGTMVAFYRERTLNVFRKPGDVQRYLHIHELGTIPALRSSAAATASSSSLLGNSGKVRAMLPPAADTTALAHWNDEFSLVAEAYRNATLSILIAEAKKGPRTYVVASPNSGEGKTTVTSNLGVALGKSKMKVVLVDGDLRKPSLHNAFALENKTGLRDILRGEVKIETAPLSDFSYNVGLANVSVIPAGNGDEELMQLLNSPALAQLLDRLSGEFDMILIDTPPTLHMADTRILAREADGAILVFRASTTTLEAAAMARDIFDRDGIPLVGTILNDFNAQREGLGGYYRNYYRYRKTQINGKAANAA